jgi:hypothetical protein
MSSQLRQYSVSIQSNQFIRPASTIIMIDTVSAAQRLALKGSSFRASEEVAATVVGGITAKLADALMVALGPRFESLSGKDVTAIFELYKATPSAAMMIKKLSSCLKHRTQLPSNEGPAHQC